MSYTPLLLALLWSTAPAPATAPPSAGAPHRSPAPSASRGAPAAAADSIRSDAEIRLAVLRHAGEVRRCYEMEGLRRDPSLNGSIDVVVTIQPTGVVTHVAVDTAALSGVGGAHVGKCLATIARHWRFERGPFVVERVILPFVLAPAAGKRPIIGS